VTEAASIVLTAPRPWYGNQQRGAFVISVDGKRAGIVMPQGTLSVACSAGRHRLRARQWWYRSPAVDVEAASGEVVRLSVGIAHRGSPVKGFLTLMFRPWRGLAITADQGNALPPGPTVAETERSRRLQVMSGSAGLVGTIGGLIGLRSRITMSSAAF
jgi:hypothetical protein